jgi:hypothetical protein
MLYDAFICHASEDKDDFVRPLAAALASHHLEIWYDEFSLSVGDGLRRAIDRGLAKSRFGIVVLSPHFFKKGWAQRELDGLVARQIAEDRRLILPIWHNVTAIDIVQFSPPLADTVALQSSRGLQAVCADLVRKLRPDESPLISARDELLRFGVEPPVISDEWWLNVVEASNRMSSYDEKGLYYALLHASRPSRFKLTKTLRASLDNLVEEALRTLGLGADVTSISEAFIRAGYIEGYFRMEKQRRARR